MKKHMIYRREDRETLRKLAIWIGCMMLLTGCVWVGIQLFS